MEGQPAPPLPPLQAATEDLQGAGSAWNVLQEWQSPESSSSCQDCLTGMGWMELHTLPCPGLKNNLGHVNSAAEDPGSPWALGLQIQWFIYCCCSW